MKDTFSIKIHSKNNISNDIILGIMSGTSLDSIDLALVKFENKSKFNLLATHTFPINQDIKTYILKVISDKNHLKEISQLNFLISEIYKEAIIEFINIYPKLKFNIIAIHGQTVWHNPQKEHIFGYDISSTLQLGNPNVLAKYFNKVIISDFRSGDIALGGQAAPLVPIFDYYFCRSNITDVICLNIGGISNITFIPKKSKLNDIIAFDCGPGNILIDFAAKYLFNEEYDQNGDFAAKGEIDNFIFDELRKIDFIYQKPPKSSGRELFTKNLFDSLLKLKEKNKVNNYDFINTLTEFTAFSIAYNIKFYASDNSKIYVSGGGAFNLFLLERLKFHLPNCIISSTNEINIPINYKEAIAFAYLGWRTINNLPSNITSVTGAERNTILGSITLP